MIIISLTTIELIINYPKINNNLTSLVKCEFLNIFTGKDYTIDKILFIFFLKKYLVLRLNQKMNSLSTKPSSKGIFKKKLAAIRDRVTEKEKKVDAVLSLSNSRTSFYLD